MINGLAQMGIGYMNICDSDVVSETNLNRQLFFDKKNLGRLKVDVIAEKLEDVEFQKFKLRVSEGNSLDLIVSDADIIR